MLKNFTNFAATKKKKTISLICAQTAKLPIFSFQYKIMFLGIDIGSTTLKYALLDNSGKLVAHNYRRHNANIAQCAEAVFSPLLAKYGDSDVSVMVTGSVGMGFAEKWGMPFTQEVVAEIEAVRNRYPSVRTLVDIGGEDSKMIFLEPGKVPDIRMNGSCAGGTGAFIDQTATLLGVEIGAFNQLAASHKTIYPIASRCGVFSKTDIQNLIARNTSKSDIAASVLTAVAMQITASLARGMDITPDVLFCGGPFAFIPELKKHCERVMGIDSEHSFMPDMAHLMPAIGCALEAGKNIATTSLRQLVNIIQNSETDAKATHITAIAEALPPLFGSDEEHNTWTEQKTKYKVRRATLDDSRPANYYLGVDSGSTTTKIVLLDEQQRLVYSDYRRNAGDSFNTFHSMLVSMRNSVTNPQNINIARSCVTGYGESLLRTAFNLDQGIVETMAHFMAAKHVNPEVSFVLDIGGQDMKAIFVENGSIKRIEINEACSSGCGSFIETYATTLGYTVSDFAHISCLARNPYDLGTRCTVFMNSKVKQAMREGAKIADIAAGFSYSVVKNCLYKVMKLRDISELGNNIVVQGGTMRNHSVVRALEIISGCQVSFTDIPELMGAYGCALHAIKSSLQ